MAKPISLQLYTLREACKQDFFGVIREVASIGYSGVEFAGLHGKRPADVAHLVKELGLKVSSSHVGLPTRDNIHQLTEQERTLDNTLLVSGFGPDQFKTLDGCKRAAEQFQNASQLCAEQGMRFACHNHWWEFHPEVEGRRPFDVLMEEVPDLQSELDIYWVAVGRANPATEVARYRGRIPVIHVKDGPLEQGKPHLPVGSGKVDIAGTIAAADAQKLEWLIVELDEFAGEMMAAVSESYKYLVSHGLATGQSVP